MAAKKLSEDIKLFIVCNLAWYKTPTEVVELVREEYEIDIKKQSVHAYDPTTKAGEALSDDLKKLFYDTRREFETSIRGIGIALQSYRLRETHRLYVRNSLAGNLVEARECLITAAKEVGGMFTNRRTLFVDAVDNARAALDILREQFKAQLEAGEITEQQLVEMVAEDHGVDPQELGTVG